MRDKSIVPSYAKVNIESRFVDINLLLNSCIPFASMISVMNLSSDLRAEVDTRKNISHEEYTSYMNRLQKMILDTEKTCKCTKK